MAFTVLGSTGFGGFQMRRRWHFEGKEPHLHHHVEIDLESTSECVFAFSRHIISAS